LNDFEIYKALKEKSDILDFLFEFPIEKIQSAKLRTIALTTRQSYETLIETLNELIDKNSQAAELNGTSLDNNLSA
jgi:hypothetical protein